MVTVGLQTIEDIVWHRAITMLTDPANSWKFPRTQARLRWQWDFDKP